MGADLFGGLAACGDALGRGRVAFLHPGPDRRGQGRVPGAVGGLAVLVESVDPHPQGGAQVGGQVVECREGVGALDGVVAFSALCLGAFAVVLVARQQQRVQVAPQGPVGVRAAWSVASGDRFVRMDVMDEVRVEGREFFLGGPGQVGVGHMASVRCRDEKDGVTRAAGQQTAR